MAAENRAGDASLSNGLDSTMPEQQPCIKHSYDVDSTTKIPPTDETRVQLYERRLKEKTGLSRKGLIVAGVVLALLFVSLIVVISLAACWPKLPHAWEYPICTSQPCLASSSKMLGLMNTSASPCQQFYEFSCGTWLSKNRSPRSDRSAWSPKLQEQFQEREAVRSLIATLPHTNDISSVHWKIKQLYESCMALEYIDTDKERPLRKVINELGGWYVLREFSVLSWDYKRTLEQLHSQHGVEPFFKVDVVPDSRFSHGLAADKEYVIRISPSGLGFPDRSYYYRHPESSLIAAYKRYLKDVVQALGATSVDANTFGVDMFHFEKRIAEITPEASTLQDPIASYNPKTLSELKIIAPSIPLHEILVAKFPKANIDDSTKIVVTSPAYLGNISLIISTTDRSSLNSYLMWQLTASYLPYLSQDYQDILNAYRKEITGARHAIPRWEFCVSTVQRFMGFALAALREISSPQTTRDKGNDVVNEMFETIRSSVENAIKSTTWLAEELKDQQLDKIISLGLQVGLPAETLSDSHLNQLYSTLRVKRSDLFTNVGYGLDFLQGSASRLLTNQGQALWLDKMASSDSVLYDPWEHKVIVPIKLIAEPKMPPSTLYGSVGIGLSHSVIESLTWPGVLYKPRGDLLFPGDPATNQSRIALRQASRCLVHDATRGNLTADHVSNRTATGAVATVSAVKYAQKAMSASGFPHVHQPALERFEADALFYVAFAQTLCTSGTSLRDDIDRTISPNAKGQAALQSALRQLPHFAETFSCSGDSPYVSSSRCEKIL